MFLLVVSVFFCAYINETHSGLIPSKINEIDLPPKFSDIQLFGLRHNYISKPLIKQNQMLNDLKQLKSSKQAKLKKLEMDKKLIEDIKRRQALKYLESRVYSNVLSDFYAGRY